LTRIGLDHGQSWRDLVSWNNLPNAHLIEVGQVLRVAPPGAMVEASGVVVQPMGGSAEVVPAAKPAAPASAPTSASAPSANDEGLGFAWPASGSVIAGFDEAKNKGLDIAGKAGDPVLAAADGQVVYAGAGLRGYGNLIILKHNNTFLTAYAHNQALLVKEDQKVRKGQKIAEMGKTDADRVKLHFEIRRQGKPVDPAKYLPAR
jgi:lipoprotein NlpD